MPSVIELKEQARTAEQQGDLVEAIEIYQHILRHLESWPDALAEELNLYTRMGDLRVELHQPARAFAAYRKAAEHYARLGAAEDVKVLCIRMINVVPSSADSYPVYAKRLLTHGHLDAALDVLREYAGKADLKDVARTVDGLTGRSSGETRALLTELLDSLERDYKGHTKAASRVSAELALVPKPPASERVPIAAPPRPAQKPAPIPEKPAASQTAPAGSETAHESTESVSQPPAVAPAEKSAAAAPVVPRGAPQPKGPAPRKENRPAAKAATARRSGSNFDWRPAGIGGAIAAGITVIVVAAVRFGGGDASSTSQAMAAMVDTSPGAVDEGVAMADSVEPATSTRAQTAPPQPASPPPRPQAEPEPEPEPVSPPTVPDTTPVLLEDTTSTVVAAADSAAADADSTLSIARPLVIGDLPVQSVAPIEFRGQSGFRVVHMLDPVTQFVVESYPVDSTSARRYPIGSIVVNNIPPDTTVSIVRFDERYLVFASGTVPEDSARVLIELLRIREPAN